MITSEAVPFVKTGGLADVAGTLPHILHQMGHEVLVILPKYSSIDYTYFDLHPTLDMIGVWMGDTQEWGKVHSTTREGIPYYFIEFHNYFDREGIYHDNNYNDYLDNPRRFGFLTRAALQLCQDLRFKPDIIHSHDWPTALASAYQKIWHWNDPILGGAASVLTIHNIAYQGVYDAGNFPYLGLQWVNFTSDKFEDHGRMNLLKGGIAYADVVNTVSPTYAQETRTPLGGMGLAPYLNAKGDRYSGILNGCDYLEWNPSTDKLIPAQYDLDNMAGKAICKEALQKRMGLEIIPNIPIIGAISRLASQKGLDLLATVIESVLHDMNAQFVILGSGEKNLEGYFGNLPRRYPGRVGSYIGYNNELSHLIEAGSDFFIMPSMYEPCGLNQMYSLKYGTLPIVRATGGLEDTVVNYDEATGMGDGFKFLNPSPPALYYTIGWAISTYYDRPHHIQKMIRTAMKKDYSWQKSAEMYVELYKQAMAVKAAY